MGESDIEEKKRKKEGKRTGLDKKRSVIRQVAFASRQGMLHQHGLVQVPVLHPRVAHTDMLQAVRRRVERFSCKGADVGQRMERKGVEGRGRW